MVQVETIVYGTAPVTTLVSAQPGVAGAAVQANGLPGPPAVSASTSIPGSMPPVTTGAPTIVPQPVLQSAPGVSFGVTSMSTPPSFPSAGGNATYPPTSGADGYAYAQAPSSNH